MKILKDIINELQKKQNKYYVNIKKLLERLSDKEVDVSDDKPIEERADGEIYGAAFRYLDSLNNLEFVELEGFAPRGSLGESMYTNHVERASYDFYMTMSNSEGFTYITMQINIYGGDPRCYSENNCSNNSYSDAILFKFEYPQEFFEIVDEFITEEATFSIDIKNKTYFVTPILGSEILWVRYDESGEFVDIPNIVAYNDKELKKEISKYNRSKCLV